MEDFLKGDDSGDDECVGLDLSDFINDFNISDYDFDLNSFGFENDSSFELGPSTVSSNSTLQAVSNQTTVSNAISTAARFNDTTTTTDFLYDLSAFERETGLDGEIDASYKDASDWIWKIVPPIVIIIGSIGNLLTILVIFRQLRRSSTAVFLVALAISDITIIYCGPIREWYKQLYDVDVRQLSQLGCKASVYFTYASLQLSSWLLVTLTMQRAIVIRWPYKDSLICSTKGALVVIAVLVGIIYGLNAHFIYGLGKSSNQPYIGLGNCDPLYATYVNFHDNIWPWVDFAIVFALPFTILLIGNCIIIRQINKQKILRRRMSTGCERAGTLYERDTRMITIMLILLSVVFFVCMVPSTIYFILMPFNNRKLDKLLCKNDLVGYTKQRDIMTFWHAVVGCLSHLNATLNFVMYVISGSRIRRDIVATFCCKQSQNNIFKACMSKRKNTYSASTIGTLAASVSPNSVVGQDQGRTSTKDLNEVAKPSSKHKYTKSSAHNKVLNSRTHTESTYVSFSDTELKTCPDDDIPAVQRGYDVSTIDIDDAVSISSNETRVNGEDEGHLSENPNEMFNTKDMARSQLGLTVNNTSKIEQISNTGDLNDHVSMTITNMDVREGDNVVGVGKGFIDENLNTVNETSIYNNSKTKSANDILNPKESTKSQLSNHVSNFGDIPVNCEAEPMCDDEECESVTFMEDDTSYGDSGMIVYNLSSDIIDLSETTDVPENASSDIDPIEDYVIATSYDTYGFCTEYGLGFV